MQYTFSPTFAIACLVKKKAFSICHADYVGYIHVLDVDWSKVDKVEVKQDLLGHLFGMMFLIIRGMLKVRLSDSVIKDWHIPFITPKSLLDESLEIDKNNYYLYTKTQGGHKDEEES